MLCAVFDGHGFVLWPVDQELRLGWRKAVVQILVHVALVVACSAVTALLFGKVQCDCGRHVQSVDECAAESMRAPSLLKQCWCRCSRHVQLTGKVVVVVLITVSSEGRAPAQLT